MGSNMWFHPLPYMHHGLRVSSPHLLLGLALRMIGSQVAQANGSYWSYRRYRGDMSRRWNCKILELWTLKNHLYSLSNHYIHAVTMGYSRPAKCEDEPLSLEAGAWPCMTHHWWKGGPIWVSLVLLHPFALGSAPFFTVSLWVNAAWFMAISTGLSHTGPMGSSNHHHFAESSYTTRWCPQTL